MSLATLLTWLIPPLAAQEVDVAGWQKDLGKAEELLVKGGNRRTVKAEKMCQETLEAMLGVIGDRPQAAELCGRVLMCMAVTEIRSGDDPGAFWHMAMAFEFHPLLARSPLAELEDVAPVVRRARVGPKKRAAMLDFEVPIDGATAPMPIGMVPLSYPRAIRQEGHIGQAEVILKIDERGFPTRPFLRNSSGIPGFDLAVMEAARFWSFTPGTDGKVPVKGNYVLNARFQLGT